MGIMTTKRNRMMLHEGMTAPLKTRASERIHHLLAFTARPHSHTAPPSPLIISICIVSISTPNRESIQGTTKARTGVLECTAEKLQMSFKEMRLTALKSSFRLSELC